MKWKFAARTTLQLIVNVAISDRKKWLTYGGQRDATALSNQELRQGDWFALAEAISLMTKSLTEWK